MLFAQDLHHLWLKLLMWIGGDMPAKLNLLGQTFGELIAIEEVKCFRV